VTYSGLRSVYAAVDAIPVRRGAAHRRRPASRSRTEALSRLRLQLIADREVADPLARRREDRVAQRGRDRRHPRLAHTAHRLAVVTGDDVHADHPWCRVHTGDLVGIEVVLLHAPILE